MNTSTITQSACLQPNTCEKSCHTAKFPKNRGVSTDMLKYIMLSLHGVMWSCSSHLLRVDLPTVKLRWREEGRVYAWWGWGWGADSASFPTRPFISNKWVCQCTEKTEQCSVPATNLKISHSEMLSDSVDLVAENTGTPSNKSSALLTETRHCITHGWPEPTTRRHSANATNAFSPGNIRAAMN